MLRFKTFIKEDVYNAYLEEKGPIASRGTLSDSMGNKSTSRHFKKYYGDDAFKKNNGTYTLAKDHEATGHKAGEEVKLDSVKPITIGKKTVYHGMIGNHAVPMSSFYKPIGGRTGKNQEALEDRQIGEIGDSIKDAISKNGNNPIRIRHPDGSMSTVAGIQKVTDGKPKADAYLHDASGNPVHWMSLKGDKFQQWGGTRGLENHPIMKDAIDKLVQLKNKFHPDSGEELPNGAAYHVSLDKNNPAVRDLLHKSMYGMDHGNAHGPNNVHAIYSGDTIGVRKTDHPDGDVYEFAPNAKYSNMSNNTDSETSDSKILVTKREGINSAGTGGRIMVANHGVSSNSRDADKVLSGEIPAKQPKVRKAPPVKVPRVKAQPMPKLPKKTKMPTSGTVGGMAFNSPIETAMGNK